MKRLLDVLLSLSLLLILSPLFLIIAAAIAITDFGPVFYCPLRVGRHEVLFRQFKFRTMRVGADKMGPWFTAEKDPRITRIGHSLRSTSLDELPQLVNVLAGSMSLVGPRPAAVPQLECYSLEQRRLRATVRPGLTGSAQISGRSELSLAETVSLDLEYCSHNGVLKDLAILIRTVPAVLGRKGTN